jgi:hypothetical protein
MHNKSFLSLYLDVNISKLTTLGDLVVSMLALNPRFPDSNPVEVDGSLTAIKIRTRLPSEGK